MAAFLQTSVRPFVPSSGIVKSRRDRMVVAAALKRDNSVAHNALLGLTAAAAALALGASPSMAEPKLPPLDTDPNRCQRAFVGNTLGMANAVSDKLLDLRFCDLSGKDLSGKALPGALLVGTNLSNTNMNEAVLSKAYAVDVNMAGADLTNAVVDRVIFTNANLTGVKFVNAVVTGSTFENANLEGVDFEDALIGSEDAKRLCLNPTLKGESRLQVGCRK